MYELSSSQLLIICEQGTQQPIIERVEMILAMALPTLTANQINALTIGERNQHLLKIRAAIFGDNIACISNCIHCQEAVEFTLDATTLITTTQPPDDFTFSIADKVHKFRLITGADLKLAMQQPTVAAVAKTLVEQCLATSENPLDVADLSDADIKQLAEQLKRHDPGAELLINLSCPACATSWQTAFDIAAFLWDEIVAYGKQLLQQVHCLAQAYGWDEATILELSTKRRQYYINQVMQ